MKLLSSTRMLSSLVALLITLSLPTGAQAFASNFADLFMPADFNRSSGKTDAAAQAQAQYGGKVLSVSELSNSGQTYYKVKLLLDSGRIKIVKIKGR